MDSLGIKIDEEPLAPKSPPKEPRKLPMKLPTELPKKVGKGLMGRILFGCMCSLIVGIVTDLPYLKLIILWICRSILIIFGNPEMPPSVEEKLKVIAQRAKDTAPPIQATAAAPGSRPSPLGRVHDFKATAVEKVEAKVEENVVHTIAPVKEAAVRATEQVVAVGDKIKKETKELHNTLDNLGRVGGSAFPAPPNPHGESAGGFRDVMRQRQEAALQRQEEARQTAVIRQASALNIRWKDRPIEDIEADIAEKKAKSGPSGYCPFCFDPKKVPSAGTQKYRCDRCKNFYTGMQARHAKPPVRGRGFR